MGEFRTFVCKDCDLDLVDNSPLSHTIGYMGINDQWEKRAVLMDFSEICGRFDNHPCEFSVIEKLQEDGYTEEEILNNTVWFECVYDTCDKKLKHVPLDQINQWHIVNPKEVECLSCGGTVLHSSVASS